MSARKSDRVLVIVTNQATQTALCSPSILLPPTHYKIYFFEFVFIDLMQIIVMTLREWYFGHLILFKAF